MQITKLENIIKLSEILKQNDFSNVNMEIIFKIKNIELLNRINEDIYYKNKTNDTPPIKHVDEIVLNINGIKFKYILDENTVENN